MSHAYASNKSSGAAIVETAGALVLSLLCVVAFFWDATLARVMISLHMNDFGRFYYSARAFLERRDMYAPSPATPWAAGVVQGAHQLLNLNPPHFHLLLLPLAILTPEAAVAVWMLASIFAFVLSLLLIAREIDFVTSGTRVVLLVLFGLACSATQAVFITGQLAFLMLLPVTLCWRDARHGRWVRAGAWLGVLVSVKLFFLIFVPYLIGGRRWKAVAAMTGAAALCLATGLIVFGVDSYSSWIGALRQSGDWAWLGMNASALGMFQRTLTTTPIFQPVALAPGLVRLWILAAGAITVTTLAAAMVDASADATDRAFAFLLVAAQLISPVGWVYYLWFAAGPLAALTLARDQMPVRSYSTNGRWLTAIALAGLVTPITAPYYFQRSALATLTIGSVYFWATFALWGRLVVGLCASPRSDASRSS